MDMGRFHESVTVFGSDHLLALAACIVGGAAFIRQAKLASEEDREKMTSFLALLLFIAYPISFFLRSSLIPDLRWQEILPLHMCSIMTLIAGLALIYECPFLRAVTYFIGTPVCAQALLTPALTYSPPSPIFFEFFVSHLLIVTAALYLPIVLGWRPRKKDFIRAFFFGLAYMIAMLALNPLLGTNYGFVTNAPEGGSILDLLGPWPWYLLGMVVAGFVGLWLISLPFRFIKNPS